MTTNEPQIQLAKNLSWLMASRKLTLAALADKLSISKSSLHNYCIGVHPRNLQTINKIAAFFEISINDLVFGKTTEPLEFIFSGNIEGEYLVKVERKSFKENF